MNIRSANALIHGLNQLAEAATMIAASVEEMAWDGIEDHAGMPGVRPITAARLETPPAVTEAAEAVVVVDPPADAYGTEPVPEPDGAAESVSDAGPAVSLEELRGVLADLSRAGHTDAIRDLIRQTGVEKLSEMAPEHYGWLLAKARELGDA